MNGTPEYVGFWLRMVAFLVDNLAAMVVAAVLAGLFFGFDLNPMAPGTDIMAVAASSGMQTLLIAGLFLGFWIYYAATPGKMLFDAYIVDAETHRQASKRQLVIRYLGYYVCLFTLFLGFLWIAFDARKQGLHDKMAGTVVIRGKPLDQQEALQ